MSGSFDVGRFSVVEWAEAGEEKGKGFTPALEKYVVEATIGRGGMGEVFLVTDQDLRRQVAMKVLRTEAAPGRQPKLHFVAEAQATSQLEHPGIPPVHDIGTTKDGRIYFTMKLVRGRTLREVLHDLLLKRREVQEEYTMHRLVTVLERIAETMHFAHERGVIHRDVKPENIMLGDYGEVHVMDWGLARVEGEKNLEVERVETARTELGLTTQTGSIKGTLPYMSPEQASGKVEALDRRTDIYAMGCVLYEILTLQPAFQPGGKDLFEKVLQNRYDPVQTRNRKRPVPEALASIAKRAMSLEKEARYGTARELAAELRAWLDGTTEREKRHAEAERLAALGEEAASKYQRFQQIVAEADAKADEEGRKYMPFQPVAEKWSAIEARRRAEDLKIEAAVAFAETIKYLQAAIVQEEDNATAREALAQLWKRRVEVAERRNIKIDSSYALMMVRRFDSGELASFVKGDGTIEIRSSPSGAEVFLYRYAERDGVLVASDERALGTTPLERLSLPMGSYLCLLKKPGFRELRYPVHITRNREWQGSVRLRTDEEIGEGFVYVPGGPFLYGEKEDTRTLEVEDFAIAKYPVTHGEYAVFLAAVEREEGIDAAMRHLPQAAGDGPYVERCEGGSYRPLPLLCEGAARERCIKEHGLSFELQLPVSGVDWHDAQAYCAWKSRMTKKQWRLPKEEEIVKAAGGVDGRKFPWGDLEDASLGKCRDSRDEPSQPEPVGTFRTAESVYGMGDAAGNSWDTTDSWFDERRTLRTLRGGSWGIEAAQLRVAYRFGIDPRFRWASVGFRCARSL